MSPRQLIWTGIMAGLLLAPGANASPEDRPDETKTPASPALNRILDDWERRSSARTSLDVRFVREDRDSQWGEKENYTGRVVLLPKGLALVEMRKHARAGQTAETERLVWTSNEFHQIRLEQKTHMTTAIATKDQGRLPAVLALPFFWHLSVDRLKSRYRIELVKEQPETWLLRITPLTENGRESFSTVFLYLDRLTYLPRRYYLVGPGDKSTKDFRVTEVRSADPPSEDLLAIPKDGEWNVDGIDREQIRSWLFSLVKPDLLP